MAMIQSGSVLVASDAAASDSYGQSVAISRDGLVMAVGAPNWEGASTDQGGVYIYDLVGGAWVQRGSVLVSPAPGASHRYGASVALNTAGTVLAVGATGASGTGLAYVYAWSGSAWVQRGSNIAASDAAANDYFGSSVALNGVGDYLAVGAQLWEGTYSNQGALYGYDWSGSAWVQRTQILTLVDISGGGFGTGCALNEAGTVLACGCKLDHSSLADPGAVYIYDISGVTWVQRGSYIKASDPNASDYFGSAVALSSDGATLAVGTPGRVAFADRGGVYLFSWSGSAWSQTEIIEPADAADSDQFGTGVACNGDFSLLVIGASGWEGGLSNQGGVYLYISPLAPVQPEWGLSLLVAVAHDHLWAWPMSLVSYAQIQPDWGLSLAVAHTQMQPEFGLSLAVSGQMQPQFGLSLAVYNAAALMATTAQAWRSVCHLGGVDVSARLQGPVRVSAEANAAAIATFSLRPLAGAFNPAAYIGAEVALAYAWTGAGITQQIGIFLGQVDAVDLDPQTFVASLTCTDRRRGLLYGSDAAALASLLPGSLWSDAVFDADADGYRMAEDRISTLCADFDLLPDGSPALTPWAAKVTPDWSFTRVLADSVGVEIGRSTDLVQQVTATFGYRFSRHRRLPA